MGSELLSWYLSAVDIFPLAGQVFVFCGLMLVLGHFIAAAVHTVRKRRAAAKFRDGVDRGRLEAPAIPVGWPVPSSGPNQFRVGVDYGQREVVMVPLESNQRIDSNAWALVPPDFDPDRADALGYALQGQHPGQPTPEDRARIRAAVKAHPPRIVNRSDSWRRP